jgi:membrane protease YdiL (CAAX protease family)
MTLFDDNPHDSDELQQPQGEDASPPAASQPAFPENSAPQLAGDPITYAAGAPSRYAPRPAVPDDLRISWSWRHFLLFLFFVLISLLAANIIVIGYLAGQHVPPKQMQRVAESNPQIAIGSSIFIFALIMLFLYVTLSLLRHTSFWRALGWRELGTGSGGKGRPWMYLLAGVGLSIFVAIAGSQVRVTDHMPMEELLGNRNGAWLVMAMAVLVAPLVEETVFRGYLYPTLARFVSGISEFFGIESSLAHRVGVVTSILSTGILFGLMHGAQLAWTWGIVGLLIVVGIIFTFARAYTGTVLASFLLHLGYNSMIAVSAIIGTHGFTKIPTH